VSHCGARDWRSRAFQPLAVARGPLFKGARLLEIVRIVFDASLAAVAA
jgi:hypothetical protein